MEWVVLLIVVVGIVVLVRAGRRKTEQAELARRDRELDAVRVVSDEDVTRFGEELRELDTDVLTATLDQAARQDYQRALASYDSAKQSLQLATRPDDVRHVTEALEDGRYAVACVRARVSGAPLPARRPPCFFNPAHGPSTTDIDWAPPGGQPRQVPVCAADADRVSQGAEPDVRMVPQGVGRVPYWQGGRAYSPWASGYYGGFATSGLLPAFLLGTLLSPAWDGGYVDGFDSGGGDGWDGDGGDGSDAGGDDGGWGGDSSDGGDGGGFGDFGGGDFGGGDFGGFDL
jgi:hypothetical protein